MRVILRRAPAAARIAPGPPPWHTPRMVPGPLIVQSDRSLLLDVHAEGYGAAREDLARFAELEKSPEHVHTYRITPISLWNAASSGMGEAEITGALERHSRYPVPGNVLADVRELLGRYGRLRLDRGQEGLTLTSRDPALLGEISRDPVLAEMLVPGPQGAHLRTEHRGRLKQRLMRLGYPVDDRVGFQPGQALPLALRRTTRGGQPFSLRSYQKAAADAFWEAGGSGVVVLPCGAGKTVVGLAILARLEAATLILCTGITAARQWRQELLDKTDLGEDAIGEYSGGRKEVRPVTLATYQVLSHRRGERYPHFELFDAADWGLIIYDEVHLLPAPVFRITAELQSRRRLGLTATLIREDGLESDVFALVGPKRFDVPWKDLERLGFIAEASCHEIRVPLSPGDRDAYAALASERHAQFRLAAENRHKDEIVAALLHRHRDASVLVIGHYVRQLERLADDLDLPLVTGRTAGPRRHELIAAFRAGDIRQLVISRIGNFSLDLPEAAVCIQVSGTFGSRQEEAQRLGRILRPKKTNAFFYSLVTGESVELGYALNRQRFLTEQGYRYYIEDWQPAPPSNVIPFPARG